MGLRRRFPLASTKLTHHAPRSFRQYTPSRFLCLGMFPPLGSSLLAFLLLRPIPFPHVPGPLRTEFRAIGIEPLSTLELAMPLVVRQGIEPSRTLTTPAEAENRRGQAPVSLDLVPEQPTYRSILPPLVSASPGRKVQVFEIRIAGVVPKKRTPTIAPDPLIHFPKMIVKFSHLPA